MAYEEILFVHGSAAEPFLHKADEDGKRALLEDLHCYYCAGQHKIVNDNELRLYADDEVIKDGPFIAWLNQEDGYVGFAKKLLH